MLGERADTRRISIHAPPRGATHGGGVLLVSLEMISIHAPPRGATKRHSTSWKRSLFQFTPLREGRRKLLIYHHVGITYFNSRPSARGDAEKDYLPNPFTISIHAPPRGATENRFLDKPVLQFQFTPLREGRLEKSGNVSKEYVISIHAPPRGATSRRDSLTNGRRIDFNSRPSARGDKRACKSADSQSYFNSRPSARGDKIPLLIISLRAYFNSRPSARGDEV